MAHAYSFNHGGDSKNNGNVFSVTDSGVANRNQTYVYDKLNRITSGGSATWTHGYQIDRYGNRHTRTASGSESPGALTLSINASNNRISGWGYDNARNVTNNTVRNFAFDADNRVKPVIDGTTALYTYAAAGQRVKKMTAEGTWCTFRDLRRTRMISRLEGLLESAGTRRGRTRLSFKTLSLRFLKDSRLPEILLPTLERHGCDPPSPQGGVGETAVYTPVL